MKENGECSTVNKTAYEPFDLDHALQAGAQIVDTISLPRCVIIILKEKRPLQRVVETSHEAA